MNVQQPRWTHVAIRCRDIDRSIAFYSEWCGLVLIHRRAEPRRDGNGERRVAWMGPRTKGPQPADFWIVLFEQGEQVGQTSLFDHLGFELESREAVEAIAGRARAAGILHWPGLDRGPTAGFLCGVRDPDGNIVEFSHGQTIETAREFTELR